MVQRETPGLQVSLEPQVLKVRPPSLPNIWGREDYQVHREFGGLKVFMEKMAPRVRLVTQDYLAPRGRRACQESAEPQGCLVTVARADRGATRALRASKVIQVAQVPPGSLAWRGAA